jgi:hypothetical protein
MRSIVLVSFALGACGGGCSPCGSVSGAQQGTVRAGSTMPIWLMMRTTAGTEYEAGFDGYEGFGQLTLELTSVSSDGTGYQTHGITTADTVDMAARGQVHITFTF